MDKLLMMLRDFKKEDAQNIAGWIRSEEDNHVYDSNPFVCGMGKDNLFAKGEK